MNWYEAMFLVLAVSVIGATFVTISLWVIYCLAKWCWSKFSNRRTSRKRLLAQIDSLQGQMFELDDRAGKHRRLCNDDYLNLRHTVQLLKQDICRHENLSYEMEGRGQYHICTMTCSDCGKREMSEDTTHTKAIDSCRSAFHPKPKKCACRK